MNRLNLKINGFAPIKNADINLKKMNVIAGFNGSGKSTSSKLLFCFLTAMSNEGIYLANRNIYDVFSEFILRWNNILNNKFNSIELPQNSSYCCLNDDFSRLSSQLENMVLNEDFSDKDSFLEELGEINQLIDLNRDDNERYQRVLKTLVGEEFDLEFKALNQSSIEFRGNFASCTFSNKIVAGGISAIEVVGEGDIDCLNFGNAIYIDSTSVFEIPARKSSESFISDKEDTLNMPYHVEYLSKLIKTKRQGAHEKDLDQKIGDVKVMIEELMEGNIYFDDGETTFKFKTGDGEFSMINTASGVKQFGVIALLLQNNHLTRDSFLIMDEPEANLHPELQVRFAEILVLLVRDVNVSLYINSHSPQFIEALEVFSGKYGLADDSRFYLSEKSADDGYVFTEIERRDLRVLYDNLGNPYDEIDLIRLENAFNGIE